MLLYALLTLGGLGLIFGLVLTYASRKFGVEVDPRVESLLKRLPDMNCGACGFPSCAKLAGLVVAGEISPEKCSNLTEEAARGIGEILGKEVALKEKKVVKVLCRGGSRAKDKFLYRGIDDCRAALLLGGGAKACQYGCLGLGSCVKTCPFAALTMGEDGIPVVDEEKCIGCGKCVASCPHSLIELAPRESEVSILCSSREKGAKVKKACEVGCIGCGKCVKICPQEAITLDDNLARIDYAKCDNCGKCVESCPTKAIQ